MIGEVLVESQGKVPGAAALTEVLRIRNKFSVERINQHPLSCNPRVANALESAHSAGSINGLLTRNTPVRVHTKLESAGIWGAFNGDFTYFRNEALSRESFVYAGVNAIRSAPLAASFQRLLATLPWVFEAPENAG